MATSTSVYLLTICCTLFSVGTSTSFHCPNQVQQQNYLHVSDYGPCQLSIQQNSNQDFNGQSILVNISLSSSKNGNCNKPIPPGYVHLPGHGYYKYHTTPKVWHDAGVTCRNEGGHLVVFNSEEEAKFVSRLPKNSYDWALIGMHDLYKEGQWYTIFDDRLDTAGYPKWRAGEPTHVDNNENCGVVFPDGLLGDYWCHSPRTFFCEIN